MMVFAKNAGKMPVYFLFPEKIYAMLLIDMSAVKFSCAVSHRHQFIHKDEKIRVKFLCDFIPVPGHGIVSVGDLLICIGQFGFGIIIFWDFLLFISTL